MPKVLISDAMDGIAEKILTLNKIDVDVKTDFTAEELFEKVPNARTFPQIWIDEKHVGGYDQFKDEV